MKTITTQDLLYICPHGKYKIYLYKDKINKLAPEFEINTPLRMAHFLAQVAQESGEFQFSEELASGSAYEGRKDLGNTHPGDGRKFKGRGLIQITGRYNYEKYKKYCGFDVVAKPYLLSQPQGAVRSAMWFWKTHLLNDVADIDDIEGITRRINGGLTHLKERKEYLRRAKQTLGLI